MRLLILTLLFTSALASENHFDPHGRLDRIELGAGWIDLMAQVKIATNSWSKIYSMDQDKTEFAEKDGKKNWLGKISDGKDIDAEIVQTATETPGGVNIEFKISALKTFDTDAIVYWIDLPSEWFVNGTYAIEGRDAAIGTLPDEVPANHILQSGTFESVRLYNPSQAIMFQAHFGKPANATLQDGRKWSKHFSLLITLLTGTIFKGQTVEFSLTLRATGSADQTPAAFKIDPSTSRYPILGIGGNYCFNLDTPEKEYTLKNLNPTYARTEISLQQWQPNLGAPPKLDAGKLPLEFQTMRQLSDNKIPFIASVWNAPDWAIRNLETTENGQPVKFTSIRPEAWQDLIESIGAYLMHAKSTYHAEPEFFSFNETDYGAKIKLTAEEHRDLIAKAGAHFEKLGLRTKCLLGDVSNPRGPLNFLKPTLDDPNAMKHVGALAFHSWGGASPAQYAAWAELAQRLKLPLIVAEAGVDPAAWKDGSFKSFENALREMTQYQELLLHAQPQAILYWEYTADYSLMSAPDSKEKRETERFAMQKHFVKFIPPGSLALAGSAAMGQVTLNAFKIPAENGAHDFTLQLTNAAWKRKARISGLPPEIKSLNVIQTSQGVLFESHPSVNVIDGAVEIDLPARSLLTLTTLKP